MSDWRTQAACRDSPTDWWFPSDGRIPGYREAIRICASCPVATECLEEALIEESDVYSRGVVGIRGGLTAKERLAMAEGRNANRLATLQSLRENQWDTCSATMAAGPGVAQTTRRTLANTDLTGGRHAG